MLELNMHLFFGTSPQFVVIVGGMHGTEQSGIEVARWIGVKLANRARPTRLGAIVIPDLFPDRDTKARTDEWNKGVVPDKWREFNDGGKTYYPNRQFPPPGNPFSFLGTNKRLKDDQGREIEVKGVKPVVVRPEVEYLIRVIETIQPVRIVSVHGKRPRTEDDLKTARDTVKCINMTADELKNWDRRTAIKGVNFQGIYVDPRYQPNSKCQTNFDVERCKFDPDVDPAFPLQGTSAKKRFNSAVTSSGQSDDAIALAAAGAVFKENADLVRGNHLDTKPETVHYAKELGTPEAFSLGDWGPVDVKNGATVVRPGAPVFTIEVMNNDESWAFLDDVQTRKENGDEIPQPPTPDQRAQGGKGRPFPTTATSKFNPNRSKELQAYAQAIIETILELP
jgi:hypothetical protein